jgi:hypothetical protein
MSRIRWQGASSRKLILQGGDCREVWIRTVFVTDNEWVGGELSEQGDDRCRHGMQSPT